MSENKRYDFNYYITKFFLKNTRLTILTLIFFTIIGVGATSLLKTTGFPSPNIGVVIVQTIYPGASSEVVDQKVTVPLEGAIKTVSGVKRYSSQSNNSVSIVSIAVDENANLDIVRSQIDSAAKGVTFPAEVQSPKIFSPEIGQSDAIYSLIGPREKLSEKYEKLKVKLSQVSDISKVEPLSDLKKDIIVKINPDKLRESGLSIDTLKAKIASFGESIPAVSNVNLDNQNVGISTSLKENELENLKNLTFTIAPPTQNPQANPSASLQQANQNIPVATPAPKIVKLTDFASVAEESRYTNNETFYSFKNKQTNGSEVLPAVVINIKAVKGSDQTNLIKDIEKQTNTITDLTYIKRQDIEKNYDSNKTYLVEGYTQAQENQEQVNEVIGGLIGSPIKQFGSLEKAGYLLGGIQLVMIVMIVLVSWRAAVISALAIPLSFLFSTLFLYILNFFSPGTGSLNTLTLFSLVLVTGLVVDPALVVLEAIQRKIDTGVKGSDAVLEGIRDVGSGVFLAMVTNIIVFAPFGVLSGIFGQIFRYIPMTIVPAIIGSYLIPLVVLAWFGGLLLRKGKNTTNVEKENLWPVAKALISVNKWILSDSLVWRLSKRFAINFSILLRIAIVLSVLATSIFTTAYMFSSGSVKAVQFAENDDGELITVTGSFLSTVTSEEKKTVTKDLLKLIASTEEVESVLPYGESNYYVFLSKPTDRNIKAKAIASKIDEKLNTQYGDLAINGNKKFFDIKAAAAQNGGGAGGYQLSLSVKTEDYTKLKTAALDVSNLLINQACLTNNKVELKSDCPAENKMVIKVDDGFTNRDNTIYDFQLDRDKLLSTPLASLGRGPLTIAVNSLIKNQFAINKSEKVTRINNLDVIIENESQPNNLDSIKNNLQKDRINIDNLGEIVKTAPKASIQRTKGEITALVQARVKTDLQNNQTVIQGLSTLVNNYYTDNNGEKTVALGLEKNSIGTFSDGQSADAAKAFTQLGIALVLAIILSYIVLAVFFNSFLQPLSIIYTIPITFIGVFPALAYFVGGQFGFLEIIGLIILIGIVENVAIFLIDGANQKIREENWNVVDAISYASGVRLRPVMLTKITTLVSLAPLAITSVFYRSISVTVIFGLLVSGFVSLITTPILFLFFKWLSSNYLSSKWWNKILFLSPLAIFYILYWGLFRRNAFQKKEIVKEIEEKKIIKIEKEDSDLEIEK
jgi:hydrophobic/amphiphilic exporter-1 (mainly G- bacteria), HAE1 family